MKALKTLKQWDRIEVKWIDSIKGGAKWCFPNPATDDPLVRKQLQIRTLGYLFHQAETYISVTLSYQEYLPRDGLRCVQSPLTIPLIAVKSIKKL